MNLHLRRNLRFSVCCHTPQGFLSSRLPVQFSRFSRFPTSRLLTRLATAELRNGIERAVAMDEAVELAKRFGTAESGAFVNGVLSHVADLLEKKS